MLEIIAVLVIIGFLVTIVGSRVRGIDEDATVIAALNNMKAAREVIREFHLDFGFIPEEIDRNRLFQDSEDDMRKQNPEYATRFLCLEKDCTNEEIQKYMRNWFFHYPDILEDGHPGCYDMAICIRDLLGESSPAVVLEYLLYDPCYNKGWRGSYTRPNAIFNATELDPDTYPADSDGNPVYLPVIETPWADKFEKMADEAEEAEESAPAQEYRKGKYYQILVDVTLECVRRSGPRGTCSEWKWKQLLDTARLVCHGTNGIDDGGALYPVPDDIGDDMVVFVFGNDIIRTPLEK